VPGLSQHVSLGSEVPKFERKDLNKPVKRERKPLLIVNPETHVVVNNPDVIKQFHETSEEPQNAFQKRTRKPIVIVNPDTHDVISNVKLNAKDEAADVREKFKRLINVSLQLTV